LMARSVAAKNHTQMSAQKNPMEISESWIEYAGLMVFDQSDGVKNVQLGNFPHAIAIAFNKSSSRLFLIVWQLSQGRPIKKSHNWFGRKLFSYPIKHAAICRKLPCSSFSALPHNWGKYDQM
jgi:hypothetical protein